MGLVRCPLRCQPWCPVVSLFFSFANGTQPDRWARRFLGWLIVPFLSHGFVFVVFPSSLEVAFGRKAPSLVPPCLLFWLVHWDLPRLSFHLRIPSVAASAAAPACVVNPLGSTLHAPNDAGTRAATSQTHVCRTSEDLRHVPMPACPFDPVSTGTVSPIEREDRFQSKGRSNRVRKGRIGHVARTRSPDTVLGPATWHAGIGRGKKVLARRKAGRGVVYVDWQAGIRGAGTRDGLATAVRSTDASTTQRTISGTIHAAQLHRPNSFPSTVRGQWKNWQSPGLLYFTKRCRARGTSLSAASRALRMASVLF